MYRVIAYNEPTDTAGFTIHDPSVNEFVSEGKLSLKDSDIDDLSLTINQNNPLFGNVRPMHTHVEVYDEDKMIFRGRALQLTREMKDSGQFLQSYTFEDISGYLIDSVQRYGVYKNETPKQFIKRLIDKHNSQVPAYKKFTLRNVTVTNGKDNKQRVVDYGTTQDVITTNLTGSIGGYILVEHKNGKNYLDYLKTPGKSHKNDTPIRISENLKSASVDVDPTSVVTRLVPLGAVKENKNTTGNNQEQAKERITISSVNGGKDYLEIPNLQKEFGIINGLVTWDDVKDSKTLLKDAKAWISKQKASTNSWSIAAVELPDYDRFKVYDSYVFINPYVATSQLLTVVGKEIDINDPNKSTLTIGDKKSKLTDYQSENKSIKQKVSSIISSVSSIEADISDVRETVDNSVTKVEALATQLGDTDVQQLSLDVEYVKASNVEITNKVAETDTHLTETDSRVTMNETNVAGLLQTVQDLSNRVAQLENEGS